MFSNSYRDLLNKLNSGGSALFLTSMKSIDEKKGRIIDKLVSTKDNLQTDFSAVGEKDSLYKEMDEVLNSGMPRLIEAAEKEAFLVEAFFPKPRLMIFGGGHIAKPLCAFGAKVGFSVAIVDDRLSFANTNRFPLANQVLCEDFKKSFDLLPPTKNDFIVIVTRGHRHDETCLKEALNYTPSYIGMIGSKRRVMELKEKLIQEGYDAEKIDKVNAPIGLDIGAITPEEIAVSIIAEVIRFRRRGGFHWPEFDLEVIQEVAKEYEGTRALVTIISTKGSVPRKAGAKMLVYPDGRTVGSIGGGCSEAHVIASARDIILNKGYRLQHIDMTGDIAEEEGMVCGGTMEVLIEALLN